MTNTLTNDERDELLRCATHATVVAREASWSQQHVLSELFRKGYLRTFKTKDIYRVRFKLVTAADHAIVILTERANAYILALRSDDFQHSEHWPLPSDIREAQKQIAERQT
jgi:hypothetical protein